jgi:hypothetical protein
VPPKAVDLLHLARHFPELLLRFEQSMSDEIISHGQAVTAQEHEQGLIALE